MGALTLKPFSDEAREWELLENESIDISDGFGTSLRLSVRESRVFLAEPRSIELPWLTDRGRLFFEGAFSDSAPDMKIRTEWSFVFDQINSILYFLDHFNFLQSDINSKQITLIFKRVCNESLDMLNKLEANFSFVKLRADRPSLPTVNLEESYQLASKFDANKLKFSSLAILIGVNTRYEGYLLNLTLRQRFLKGGFKIMSLGPLINLTIPSVCIGSKTGTLVSIAEGIAPVCREISKASMPVFLTNSQFLNHINRTHLENILPSTAFGTAGDLGLAVMSDRIESTGKNDFRNYKVFSFKDFSSSNALYYVNVDFESNSEVKKLINLNLLNIFNISRAKTSTGLKSAFVHSELSTNQESLIDRKNLLATQPGALSCYSFLPVKGFFGENSTYRDVEGLTKKSIKVVNLTQNAKSNWQLLRYLHFSFSKLQFLSQRKDHSLISGLLLNFSDQNNYQIFICQASNNLSLTSGLLEMSSSPFMDGVLRFHKKFKNPNITLANFKLKYWLDDFFVGGNKDAFSHNSPTLTKCSVATRSVSTNFF